MKSNTIFSPLPPSSPAIMIPDCVPDATTLCIPNNSTAIQYGPAGAHAWSLGTVLAMNPEGVWVPVAETHVKGATAQLSFTGGFAPHCAVLCSR